MLLNRIPCLDKGYVALLDSSNTTSKLREIGEEFFGGEYPISLEELGTMTVVMKCPLFVQLYLSKFNLKVINADRGSNQEAYVPSAVAIGATEVGISQDISDDILRTTDALFINPKAYQADGADRFVSQVLTPISTYTTLIVSGSYSEWCKTTCPSRLPLPISEYIKAIEQIIECEWK